MESSCPNKIDRWPIKWRNCQNVDNYLSFGSADGTGTNTASFVETSQNFGDATVRNQQLSGNIAGPDTEQSQFHYSTSYTVRKWTSVYENPTQLVYSGLSCEQNYKSAAILIVCQLSFFKLSVTVDSDRSRGCETITHLPVWGIVFSQSETGKISIKNRTNKHL